MGDMETLHDSRYAFEVEAEKRGIEKGRAAMYNVVRNSRLFLEDAAQYAGMSIPDFKFAMSAYDSAAPGSPHAASSECPGRG